MVQAEAKGVFPESLVLSKRPPTGGYPLTFAALHHKVTIYICAAARRRGRCNMRASRIASDTHEHGATQQGNGCVASCEGLSYGTAV